MVLTNNLLAAMILTHRLLTDVAVTHRYHKLHVIMGGWWWKERRPAPDSLFCPYSKIPRESRALLER